MHPFPPRTSQDELLLRLRQLARRFRSTRDEAARHTIAKEYAQTVDRLIQTGTWEEMPGPEDQLPDEWMPQAFFDYLFAEQEPSPGPAGPGNLGSVLDTSASFRFRLFFDTGSGTCLWSDNATARERFGYPVDLGKLPISQTLRRRGAFLIAWHDTFTDWDNLPAPSRWWPREASAFRAAVQEYLALLREHLGPDFLIVDESGTATPA
jgi:hypothetical protein